MSFLAQRERPARRNWSTHGMSDHSGADGSSRLPVRLLACREAFLQKGCVLRSPQKRNATISLRGAASFSPPSPSWPWLPAPIPKEATPECSPSLSPLTSSWQPFLRSAEFRARLNHIIAGIRRKHAPLMPVRGREGTTPDNPPNPFQNPF